MKKGFGIFRLLKEKVLAVIRIWVPVNCPLCGGLSVDGRPNMFCKDCLLEMPFLQEPYCQLCGGERDGILDICTECCSTKELRPWQEARAVFRMEGK